MPEPESLPLAWPALVALFLLGYLLGSIPFGLLLTRLAGLGDIRSIGSGNIGATNVLRTGHKGLAAATLLLDALKGTAAGTDRLALGPLRCFGSRNWCIRRPLLSRLAAVPGRQRRGHVSRRPARSALAHHAHHRAGLDRHGSRDTLFITVRSCRQPHRAHHVGALRLHRDCSGHAAACGHHLAPPQGEHRASPRWRGNADWQALEDGAR